MLIENYNSSENKLFKKELRDFIQIKWIALLLNSCNIEK